MLWQVKGSGLFLLGSVHVLDVPPLPLNAAAWAAFGAATRVLFEHDLAQAPDVSFARLPPGESLSLLIPASLYASLEDRCREWSIDIGNFSGLQPWLVAISLSLKTAALAGMDPAYGVDKNLLPLARAQGKRIEFLEDAAGALRNFAAAPMAEQIKMLSLAAQDVPGGIDFFQRLIGGWKAGRADLVRGARTVAPEMKQADATVRSHPRATRFREVPCRAIADRTDDPVAAGHLPNDARPVGRDE